ncbi:MAG: type II secretion system protein GspE, partial [Candidatus Omnitrophota bacterium]
MSKTLKGKIIDNLIKEKRIREEDLTDALRRQKEKGEDLDRILLEKGLITEQELLIVLAKELNIPPIDLAKYKIDADLLKLVPERLARQYHMIPISKIGSTLTVVMSDPFNIFAVDDLKNLTGLDVDMAMTTDSDILRAINSYYGKGVVTSVSEVIKDYEEEKEEEGVAVVEE